MIKDTILLERILEEVAQNLIRGTILREWKNSKIVMIPKLGKDHQKSKVCRPINLFDCVGKVVEKVVASVLQGCRLRHKHQIGLGKGRLASETALRTVTRAQQYIVNGGEVG